MKSIILTSCILSMLVVGINSCKKHKRGTTTPVKQVVDKKVVSYDAQEVIPAFSSNGKVKNVNYTMLNKASKKWKICVSFPHMKDAYWLGVNYGVSSQAKKLGVKLNIAEAGGYTNLNKQISQIEDCISNGVDAIVLGAISRDGLNNVIKEASQKGIPVIDLVNGVSSKEIKAKSLVSFYTMGYETGAYLAKKYPKGSAGVQVGWFPGPAGAGWVEAAHKGFMEAVKNSSLQVLEPKFGDTGKETQLKLVEDILQSNPNVKYIAGTAVTVEAAQGLIREKGLIGKVQLLSFYMTPGVYSGIKRNFVLAAPADCMVLQGRFAIDQAVRILEVKNYLRHVGPKIQIIDASNISVVPRENILPPKHFKPVFNID